MNLLISKNVIAAILVVAGKGSAANVLVITGLKKSSLPVISLKIYKKHTIDQLKNL